jgi:hypothetical protein
MKENKLFNYIVIQEINQFLFDFFIKYAKRYNQTEYHNFLKQVQLLDTDKLYNLFQKYITKKKCQNIYTLYDSMMEMIISSLNTYNIEFISLKDFLYGCFQKTIPLFSKFNRYRDTTHLHLLLDKLIKKHIFTVIPILDIIKQNVINKPIDSINHSFDFNSNIILDPVQSNISRLETPILPILNINDYKYINKTSTIDLFENKLEKKEITLSLTNKKHLDQFYQNFK